MIFAPRWRLGSAGRAASVVAAALLALAPPAGPAADPADKAPDGLIVLTKEEYQKLLDEIARLKAQAEPDRPAPPSSCKLTGEAAGDLARLKVQFGFATYRKQARVALGCRQGNPTAATLDGQRADLRWAEDGWVAVIDRPGAHELTLELEVPLAGKGADLGFELGLPGAAVTRLEGLKLPEGAKAVRLGGQAVPAPPGPDQRPLLSRALGAAEQLEVAWTGPAVRPPTATLLTAEGRLFVQVAETSVTTRMELLLRDAAGQADQFRLLVPAQAEVKPGPGEDPQKVTVEASRANRFLRTVRLKEPRADAVRLDVTFSQPRQAGKAVPVQPAVLLGAAPQRGVLFVSKPPDLQVRYLPRDSAVTVNPRDPTDDERQRDPTLAAAFTYWNVLAPDAPSQGPAPLLDLAVEKIKAALEAKVTHTLTLTRDDADGFAWQAKTQLDVTPNRTPGVESVQVQLPPADEYTFLPDVQPTRLVQGVDVDPARRVARLQLDRPQRPFTLTWEGRYAAAKGGEATLRLPYPLDTQGRGCDVKVVVPREFRLVPPRPDDMTGDAPAAGGRAPVYEQTVSLKRWPPDQVKVAWEPYRPELVVENVVEVTLAGPDAAVQQRLTPRGATPPAELVLRVPERVAEAVLVLAADADGAEKFVRLAEAADRVGTARDGFETWSISLRDPKKDRKAKLPLTLRYAAAVPRPPERADLPLVRVERATRLETTVYAWGPPGALLTRDGDGWEEQPVRPARERDSLPDLVLTTANPEPALALRPAAASAAKVRVEKALVRVAVAKDGAPVYHASFLVSRLFTPFLDVELPAPVTRVTAPRVWLRVPRDGGGCDELEGEPEPIDDNGQPAESGRAVRLAQALRPGGGREHVKPGLVRPGRPVILEVEYQAPPGRGGVAALVQTGLQAPTLRGEVNRFPVRWQVELPAGWLPLAAAGADDLGRRWGLRGWLPGPRPAHSRADLEHWLYPDELRPQDEPDGHPALALGASALEPVRLTHVPQQAWLLACSVLVVAGGLALYLLALTRARPWPVLAALGVAALVAALWWPNVFAAVVYGCEPGVLVLLAVLGVQWTVQQRYRRQVVFMPGFKRVKTGSSLVRAGSSHRPRAEPPTVDVAAPPGGGSKP